MSSDFVQPEVRLGDPVYWYHDPTSMADPCIGWISRRPGAHTVCILIFAPDSGFQEKMSVRHKDDPGLHENPAWRQWGCWEFSPAHKQAMRVHEIGATLVVQQAREGKKQLAESK
jgi:hypothetical protein